MAKKKDSDTVIKQLSNPYSTGGGGVLFENHVQSAFVVIMLSKGIVPCMPRKQISKIQLQCRYDGFNTDDLVAFTTDTSTQNEHKLLAQIKHNISITKSDPIFQEVITAAWSDYNNPSVFNRNKDIIMLITGPISKKDNNDSRTILEWARHSDNEKEFIEKKVHLSKFSSKSKIDKLNVFRETLEKANSNKKISDFELFDFLKHFYIIGFDLDIKTGATLSLLHSLITQYSATNSQSIWSRITDEVLSFNQNAGTITFDTIPDDIISIFEQKAEEKIPLGYAKPAVTLETIGVETPEILDSLLIASIIGGWDEGKESDNDMLKRLSDGF